MGHDYRKMVECTDAAPPSYDRMDSDFFADGYHVEYDMLPLAAGNQAMQDAVDSTPRLEGPGDPVFDAFGQWLRSLAKPNEEPMGTNASDPTMETTLDRLLGPSGAYRHLADDEIQHLSPADQEAYFEMEDWHPQVDNILPPEKDFAPGEFPLLDEHRRSLLTAEDDAFYAEMEKAYLEDYWREDQRNKINDLGEDTYRISFPEDAARFFGEE